MSEILAEIIIIGIPIVIILCAVILALGYLLSRDSVMHSMSNFIEVNKIPITKTICIHKILKVKDGFEVQLLLPMPDPLKICRRSILIKQGEDYKQPIFDMLNDFRQDIVNSFKK